MAGRKGPWRNKEPCQNVTRSRVIFGGWLLLRLIAKDSDQASAKTPVLLSHLLSAESEGISSLPRLVLNVPSAVARVNTCWGGRIFGVKISDTLKVEHHLPSHKPLQDQSGNAGAVFMGRTSPCGAK